MQRKIKNIENHDYLQKKKLIPSLVNIFTRHH